MYAVLEPQQLIANENMP